MTTIVEMRVHMDCSGCEMKIKKVLQKMKGVDNIEIDMAMQKVTVTGWADQKKVLKTVRKTGRRAELWQLPYNPDYDNYTNRSNHQCTTTTTTTGGPVANYAYDYASQPSSSYNYYKHGYDNHNVGGAGYYSHHRPANSGIFGEQSGAVFSDENPHGCSIM